ncbi:MAG: hypothetical protein ACYDBV_15440 [Nitrospiria bacterium]
MITVSISINGEPIFTRTAVRNKGSDGTIATYTVDDGTIIAHRRDDGAIVLAKAMLDTIKEQGIEK